MKFLFLSSYAHLILDSESTRTSGGAELQVALLAAELVKRGHEAIIISGDEGQPRDRLLQGVRCVTGGKFQTGGLLDTLTTIPKVFHILREEKPDFTIVRGWTAWLYFLLQFKKLCAAKSRRLVYICSLDTELNGEFRRENGWRGALFERGVRFADARFAMTKHQESLFEKLGLTCAIYRNLILPPEDSQDSAAPKTSLTANKDIDFLWVARCQPIKQPQQFLDLAEQFPEARCVMVCPKENVELWDAVSARASRLANVEFCESVPYREIQNVYDRAKIFVNTSRFEGFANSFIQAGTGGTAILSLTVNPDNFLNEFHAGACAETDWKSFLQLARSLLANENNVLTQSQKGSQLFVNELHNNAKNVDDFLAGLPALP